MIAAVKQFAEGEGPIYAECGGFIYLSQKLTNVNGDSCPMDGVLPTHISMTPRPVKFGNAEVDISSPTIWAPARYNPVHRDEQMYSMSTTKRLLDIQPCHSLFGRESVSHWAAMSVTANSGALLRGAGSYAKRRTLL
jgi:cobyrinic acid a,c-diamide synthase